MGSRLLPEIDLSGFRNRLARADAQPQFALLGLVSGVFTGLVICAFRYTLEAPLGEFLPGGDPENFEELPREARFLLPVIGAAVLGIWFGRMKEFRRRVGIIHVLERLNYHQAHIGLRSALVQYFGATIALISGQSVGREGPAVHLGAATGSVIGQWLKLPNNSVRTLVGCGTAAAIAAAFNTPMAGVIFAMEVVMMEYSILGFMPIIIAAVSGSVVSQLIFSGDPVFLVPEIPMQSHWELFYIAFIGFVIGLLAVLFINIVRMVTRERSLRVEIRFLMAGLLTGLVAWHVPAVMGVGYDTVNHAIFGDLAFTTLCVVMVTKLVLSAIVVGLGLPGGVIGPALFIGAAAGGALGIAGSWFVPEHASSPGFYAMLGMGAMMGAVLQAPLAALVALMELTHNPEIILPGMLAITVANLTASEGFREKSLFKAMLEIQGIVIENSPVAQLLRRAGVTSIMNRSFVRLSREVSIDEARKAVQGQTRWVIVEEGDRKIALMPAADLAAHIVTLEQEQQEQLAERTEPSAGEDATPGEDADSEPATVIDLLAIPARRRELGRSHSRATLQEALDKLDEKGLQALFIVRTDAPMIAPVLGVVTRDDLENCYKYHK